MGCGAGGAVDDGAGAEAGLAGGGITVETVPADGPVAAAGMSPPPPQAVRASTAVVARAPSWRIGRNNPTGAVHSAGDEKLDD